MQSYFVECKIIHTFSFDARWRRLVRFKHRPLLQRGRNSHCPLDRRFDGSPKQFGHCRNENNFCSYWDSNPDIPVRKFVIHKTLDRNIGIWTRIQPCDVQYWHLAKIQNLISYRASSRDVYGHQQVAREHKASVFGPTVSGLRHFPGIPLAFPRDRVSGCMIISYLTQKRITHHCNNRRLHVRYNISSAEKHS
jgi:hypothetical protein